MKKVISAISLSVFVLIFSNFATAQKADFTGTWKIDSTKIPVTGNFPVLIQITINIKGDSLLTERLYDTGDGQVYPFDENLTLDGKECMITIYDMPRKTKVSWLEKDVILILESTTTANSSNGPADFKSIETWTVDNINNILTISFKNNSYAGEVTGAFIFNKSDNNNGL
jgi:hypothetical protein